MTLAGKKLQTIYDNGTEALADIENKTMANLDKVAKVHNENRSNEMANDSLKLEEKGREIESELNVTMDRSISRLEELKAEQSEKCRLHADKLAEELKSAGASIKSSLSHLISAMQEQLVDVEQEICYQYDSEFEGSVMVLENQCFNSNKNIRAHALSLVGAMQQKLDQSLWETKGSEKQIVASLYKNYMSKASSIETHFARLIKQLSEDFQTHQSELQQAAQSAGAGVSLTTEQSLQSLDRVTSKLEREINQFFGEIISTCSQDLDSGLGAIARDITNSHTQAGSGLSQKTQDYSASLLAAANSAQEKLKNYCQESTARAGKLKDEFIERMDRKVEESKKQRSALEQAKEKSIENIRQELVAIRKDFQDNLTSLAEAAQASVQAVTHEVEKDVRAAHNRCTAKLETDGLSAKNEIDKEVERLLGLIAAHKEAALREIVAAAGVDHSHKS